MSYTETPTQGRPSRRELHQRRRDTKAQRRRKLQALAAGGLVLGVGASATLAAWNDDESSVGTFTAGEFAMEANIDGTWRGEKEMTFSTSGLFPGQSVYAPVSLRSTVDTTVDGAVTVTEATASGGLVPDLNYRAVEVQSSQEECSDKAFTNKSNQYVFGSPTQFVSMGSAPAAKDTQLLKAGQAETISYCFEVQLDPAASNESQKQSATITWEFYAESIIPNENV